MDRLRSRVLLEMDTLVRTVASDPERTQWENLTRTERIEYSLNTRCMFATARLDVQIKTKAAAVWYEMNRSGCVT